MIQKKTQRYVNFKGLKLALKNLVQFSSPTASGVILRGKYQHFGLTNFFKLQDLTILYTIMKENSEKS